MQFTTQASKDQSSRNWVHLLWQKICVVVLAMLLSFGFVCHTQQPAWASIHEYPEGAEQVMQRSLQTLRDSSDRAWQLVLFKRTKAGQTQMVHLRLIGFPGAVELTHPGSLHLGTLRGDKAWQAEEVLEGVPHAAHIGEYDVLEFMRQLDADLPLKLTLPLAEADQEIVLPPYVIKEWRQVVFR
ncbi:MAG TPA: DUF3122 domain-containing protein [Leptolyngbyaceae cyanobacterium M33_DOE_097]|nr:DUF3122 domain-containing protein [Leptolyngbyaceae cyanobacterium M33_DOE_097]